MGGGDSPYAYVEILRLRDPARLGEDVKSPTMQNVVNTFRSMADNPLFIVTAAL
jgi:hypothetical protein